MKNMNIENIKNEFSVDDQIDIVEGKNGMPCVVINNQSATALISLYGGQVLSYKPVEKAECLFLSKLAIYQQGAAIKGGIPVCWPWFGADPENKGGQSHGFARNKMWELRSIERLSDSQSRVVMGLVEDEETMLLWPCEFDLEIEITIGETLDVKLRTKNTGKQKILITQALHTYLSVDDIKNITLQGLDNKKYLDKANINTGAEEKEQSGNVEFNQEVDRIYLNVPASMQLIDTLRKQQVDISSTGNKTAVVWNPGADISQQMSDLGNTDFQRFVCVETANAASDVIEIKPGESFVLSACYGVSSLV